MNNIRSVGSCFAETGRIEYIDTCKGILIIMLVFCHINSMAKGLLPEVSMIRLDILDITKYLYVPYFMQTFFFITGFCSNFNRAFKPFLIDNCKTLIIPLIVFSTIDQLFNSIIFKTNFFFVEVLGKEIFYILELFWFLSALFIAKFLMFIIQRVTKRTLFQIGIVVMLFLFATFFIKYRFHSFNYLHWHNALSMLPFLYLGFLFRKYSIFQNLRNNYYLFISLSYWVIVIALFFSNRLIPYYTHFHHYTWIYVPLYLWLAFSGSIMIVYLSKCIPPRKWLTYLGKNTIIVYGMHFMILSITILMLRALFIPESYVQGVLFYLITGGMTILFVYVFCHIFQKKPLSYLIGRF